MSVCVCSRMGAFERELSSTVDEILAALGRHPQTTHTSATPTPLVVPWRHRRSVTWPVQHVVVVSLATQTLCRVDNSSLTSQQVILRRQTVRFAMHHRDAFRYLTRARLLDVFCQRFILLISSSSFYRALPYSSACVSLEQRVKNSGPFEDFKPIASSQFFVNVHLFWFWQYRLRPAWSLISDVVSRDPCLSVLLIDCMARCFIHRLISPMHQTCIGLLLNSSVDPAIQPELKTDAPSCCQ